MIFGAQYYRPPFPGRECWDRDFANMARLGFNTVKLWAVWNWIEPVQGTLDFTDLDELCALARRHGLEVVINTVPEGSPPWSLAGNEDALYRTARGESITYGGPPNLPSAGWPGLCIDKPEAAALVTGFIRAVAARYRLDENVVAIDVWNEPHLEPMFDYRSELLCYCDHSRAAFRTWLKDKYGTIEAINAAWFRRLTDWDEIDPPPRFGTWTDMLDWRLFWMANLARHLRLRVEAARQGAPGKTIQTHVAYSAMLGNKLAGGLANELGDEFSLAREVDVFGLSSFPKWLQGKDHAFVHLAHNEVVAEASRGKRFYQVELQGGGGKAGLLGGEVPTGGDVTVWNYNTIAAGGKGVLYWQYAPEPAGMESPGFGLTAFDGGNNERSLASGVCARELSDKRLDTARRVLPVNAVYLSRKSETLCFCADRREDLYAGSAAGVYRAAYQARIPVRFVHEDYVDSLADEGVKVLYVPMALSLSEKEISAFRRFVEAGGTLVGEAGTGLYDKSGTLDQGSRAITELFGVDHAEIEAFPEWGFADAYYEAGPTSDFVGGPPRAAAPNGAASADRVPNSEASQTAGAGNSRTAFSGAQYRRVVVPHPGTELAARFADGVPAATSRALGKGRAVFVATFPALEYHLRGTVATGGFIAGFFDPAGYPQLCSIQLRGEATGLSAPRPQPVVRLLETADGYALATVNHRKEAVCIEVVFNAGCTREDRVTISLEGESGAVRFVGR
jgi:beta-galactosidase GanA